MRPIRPHGEDGTNGARALPVTINSPGTPPGEDGLTAGLGPGVELENEAAQQAAEPEGVDNEAMIGGDEIDFLRLVREAEDQALLYVSQVNRKAWTQTLRAFHQEHYTGSKYTRPEYRGRSRLFVPKTRAAVRKDNAAVAASLFNNIDAINCVPGNESDPKQRAAAAIMEELVNYRTDRSSGKASFPWFLVSMGARQNAVLTGVCASKQYWKQDYRKTGTERISVENPETGVFEEVERDTYALEIDRPDMLLIPPENLVIDPSADWTNPAQSAAFIILKWPMQIDEILQKQQAPVNPWNAVSEEALKGSTVNSKFDAAAIRRARERGLDRMDETQTGTTFQIIWVYEVFMRVEGEDYTFYSIGDQEYLTDPRPVRDVYPEQFGERPVCFGYGSLESHSIYPMAAAEAWQPLQAEVNDIRNLMLDATKQNVMPISKVKRGRQIDLDQVRRRSSGSSIIVQDKDDVTWETPPQLPSSGISMTRELDIEFDDLAGQQNYGTVERNNALAKTLGGLKLAAGAANAVQEFDIRIWIETWVAPALSQIVRLEQYYESDATVLGLCGNKAQLFQKYGINKIDDELLEQQITVRVSVGLGAGDPQARLAKFQTAAAIVGPILEKSNDFQSGKREIDIEAVIEEVFGAAGYRDGGARFFKENEKPRDNKMADLKTKEVEAKIARDERTGRAALLTGMANVAKVALGKRELESNVVDQLVTYHNDARDTGFDHAHRQHDAHLAALDHGNRHGLAIASHRHQVGQSEREAALNAAAQEAGPEPGGGVEMGDQAQTSPPAGPPVAAPPGPPSASPPTGGMPQGMPAGGPQAALMQLLADGKIEFTRDPHTDRINGFKLPQMPRPPAGQFPIPPAA